MSASLRQKVLLVLGALGVAWAAAGCHRSYYRVQADQEAACVVAEHAQDPRWNLPELNLEVDPRSRMYDPFCRDFPPLPPDDPAAHRLMHCVNCQAGYPCWHASGDTTSVENPNWQDFLPLDAHGELEIDIDSAVRLGRRHSRTYQQQLEELYLSALDVSFERFRFDSQFFAGYDVTYTADGPARAGSGGESSSELAASTRAGGHEWEMRKLFATGSELVVSLANELVWQFSGPDTQAATTLLSFSFLQPLLREAGRDRVLERLTLAERLLLANVREMERYRQSFYVELVTGRDAGSGPQRSGGVFGGSGLEGFSGVGAGGFGRVTGGTTANTTGAGQVGGFLGLVQQQQQIRNQEANIVALRSSLSQLEAFFQANRIDYFQVELARQALYNAQSQLLVANTQYENGLDSYKLRLGLPPQLNVKVSDAAVAPFNLIDRSIKEREACLTLIQEEITSAARPHLARLQQALQTAEQQMPPAEPSLAWSDDWQQLVIDLGKQAASVERERGRIVGEVLPLVAKDVARFEAVCDQRQAELARLKARYQATRRALVHDPASGLCETLPYFDEALFDAQRPAELAERLQAGVVELTAQLEQRRRELERAGQHLAELAAPEARPRESAALYRALREKVFFGREGTPLTEAAAPGEGIPTLPGVVSDLASHLVALTVIQAEARAELVSLVDVQLDAPSALEIARENRLDWMNARASLVNSWRLIEFNADALESTLDVVFRGDLQNEGPNPLSLNDATGRLQAGVQFDAPLTRLRERNTYRQSLIEFQQARRNYYAFEDQIARSLRDSLRSVELHQVNFELRRAAVHVAARQVDFATLRLQAPPQPGETAAFGDTTARDLVSALSGLLDAQNDFLGVWVNYEALRRSLALDLGTMQLDAEGIWVDTGSPAPPATACQPPAAPTAATTATAKAAARTATSSSDIPVLRSVLRDSHVVPASALEPADAPSPPSPRTAGRIDRGEDPRSTRFRR